MSRQSNNKGGVGVVLQANPTPAAQATPQSFKLSRLEFCKPGYDHTALHAWFGAAHIEMARLATAKAGVVPSKNTTQAKDGQLTTLPISESA